MKKFDCIFLDRDGTLNPDPGYINNISNYILSFKKSTQEQKVEVIEKYISEKLNNNIELLSQKNSVIRDFLKYESFFLNGKKYSL